MVDLDLLEELLRTAERHAREDVPRGEPITGYALVIGRDGRRTLVAMPDLDGRQRAWALRLLALESKATHLVLWQEAWVAIVDEKKLREDPVLRRFMAREIKAVRDLPPNYRSDRVVLYAEAEGRVQRSRAFEITGHMPERRMAAFAVMTDFTDAGNVFYPILPANLLAERVVGPLRPPNRDDLLRPGGSRG